MRSPRLLPLFAVLVLVSCFSVEAQQPPVLPHGDEQAVPIQPSRPVSSVALASGALRSAVERLQRGQTLGPAIDVVDSKIRVEVLHDLESTEIRAVITDLGGTVEGEIGGFLVQALVPFDRLVALESHDGVQFVRSLLEANIPILPPSDDVSALQNGSPIVGEEVVKTNADAWHAAGYTGAGVKVGIVDYFDGVLWSNAQAAGELPMPAGTFCEWEGSSCDIWTTGSQHGEAVAEIIHEMAPGAQLYLATARTVTDLQAAVDYFDTQGVDIISRSLTGKYDGPGDGTGPVATVMDNAVADGMVWFNAAGNNAGDGSYDGSYWRGGWIDSDGDDWLDFAPGDELMSFYCVFLNGLRWSDFGAGSVTDYDVYVFDNPGDSSPISWSEDDQTGGAPPLELAMSCNPNDVDYLAIHLWDAGNGTSGDVLEFMTNGSPVEHWQNPYSASGPASDTASPGGLSVGAVDPPLGTDIAYYSSQGPTNDGLYGGTDRIKPDISAAAGVASYTYGIFSGTSASTPAAAGAAALVIEAGLASTPAEVKTYLLSNATVDRGAPGPDNVFGEGELLLGSPPLPDSDGDGVPDDTDNCPDDWNPDQEDIVHPGDGGDACEDYDSDTVVDADDNCPDDAKEDQANSDTDNDGDACDNCWSDDNSDQADADGDCPAGPYASDPDCGDVCDVCPNDANDDADGDAICAGTGYQSPMTGDEDNCPDDPNPGQEDFEPDGIGDECDDSDGDSLGQGPPLAGFLRDAVELFIGTDPLDECADTATPNDETGVGESPWAPDFNDNGQTDIGDLVTLKNHWVPLGNPYGIRYDLNATGDCDIGDLVVLKQYWIGSGYDTCPVG